MAARLMVTRLVVGSAFAGSLRFGCGPLAQAMSPDILRRCKSGSDRPPGRRQFQQQDISVLERASRQDDSS